MTYPVKSPKKLIEVALPLDAINEASAREKSIRHGHPSTLHLWWARRPLAAARAVLFAQLVNDPSWKWELENPGAIPPNHLKASWAASRKRLFKIIADLVQWENTTNEEVLAKARAEIRRSWREVCELNQAHPQAAELFNPEQLPAFHDPFAGGGAIPLEAQRLGLEAYASDLNPVAVLINKAMIEIPPKFAGRPPVSLAAQDRNQQKMPLNLAQEWPGATGLAEDVRYYGQWMRDEAEKRIGHLYPKVEITAELAQERPELKLLVGQKLTIIAWLWARTIKCPNPICGCNIPLLSSLILSSKAGKETYLVPSFKLNSGLHFDIVTQKPVRLKNVEKGFKRGVSGVFECPNCGTVTTRDYTATQATSVGLSAVQTAIVCEGKHGRIYLPAKYGILPSGIPQADVTGLTIEFAPNPRDVWCRNFGLVTPADLFTPRQLVALTTFCDLVQETREQVLHAAQAAGLSNDSKGLDSGGIGATAYADAVSVYLAFIVDKLSESHSSLCTWSNSPKNELVVSTFRRQALPMTWDFGEANPFAASSGSITKVIEAETKVLTTSLPALAVGESLQIDAQTQSLSLNKVVSTDPPYYDNIGYADLSDFFYVWLRRSLKPIFPILFATLTVPKAEELVAKPYRHSTKLEAEAFFLAGMTNAMQCLAEQANSGFPVTIYYAFKQAENESGGTSSTGWETFLAAVIQAGFTISGTWPMRTERSERSVSIGNNSLASSIILVCRKRPGDATTIGRRQFLRELNAILPEALDEMTKGAGDDISPVAPVDLSQAIIGPGMAVFSKYAAVLEADGSPMSVRTALQLINRFLAEDDFDADTQFCLHWFDQYGWDEGVYGEADVLARAKATSVAGLAESGVVRSGGGKVRLLRPHDYPADWNPAKDTRLPIWEALHQLIRALRHQGETGAGELLAAVKAKGEGVRQLAYRLYTLCERRGWAEDARAYNELITSWSGIESAASELAKPLRQGSFFNE